MATRIPPYWTVPYEDGYRYDLYSMLTNTHYPIQYVGGSPEPYNNAFGGQVNNPDPDLRSIGEDNFEAFGGYQTQNILALLPGALQAYNPKLILLQIGTNDLAAGSESPSAFAQSQANLTQIVQDVVTQDHGSRLIVAQITPEATYVPEIVQWNSWIANTLVPQFSADNVGTVDLYDPLLVNGQPSVSMFANGSTHPTNYGYLLMAQAWYTAITGQTYNLLSGDTNFDGTVNLTDLLNLLNNYGQTGLGWAQGDFNGDGAVNLTDLLALLNNYGDAAKEPNFSGAVAVPEPGKTGSVISCLCLFALRLRPRQNRT